jgi:DNA repair protein RadD
VTPTLRQYQKDLDLETWLAFEFIAARVLLVLPTGGGKTVLFSKIAADTKGVTWIIAHRQELIRQASETLDRFGIDHGTVKSGFPFQPEKRVQVASMQTIVRRAATMPPPELIILDEAHHCLCPTIGKILAAAPRAKVLGVTATPCRTNGAGLGSVFDHLIIGPTNRWLTDQGFLSPAFYYAPPPKADVSNLPMRSGDYAREAAEAAMDKAVVTGDAVEHYRRICDGVPMLSFCVSVEHAKHVAAQYVEAGYRAAAVDGALDDDERKDRILGLATGKYQVITSCDLIGEGLDVPLVGAVQLLRPTASLSLHLQQIGRGLRPAEGKEACYVLDHVGNVEKHKFASTVHPWSLEGTVKPRKEKAESVRTCGSCFMVHETAKTCPFCGYVYPVKSRVLSKMEIVDGELVRIEETKEERAQAITEARTLPELIAFAKARKYKRPTYWARMVYRGRSHLEYMPKLR